MNNAGKMFQPEYVKAFITYIPVYPKGRNVILSDGNVAVVVENRQYHTLYPLAVFSIFLRYLSSCLFQCLQFTSLPESEFFFRIVKHVTSFDAHNVNSADDNF